MLITLSRRAAICQSVAEVQLTGLAPLGAVSHRFIIFILFISDKTIKWILFYTIIIFLCLLT